MRLQYRFSFQNAFIRKDYALFAGGAVRSMSGFCYTETYIPVSVRRFRTDWGSTLSVQGIFYDVDKQPIDYWGADRNQRGGIVYAPDDTAYIRANWDTDKLSTAYLGLIDGTDNWLGSSQCYPVYKDDLCLEYEKENGQQFRRAKWSGKLTFLGGDYTAITTGGINKQWNLLAEVTADGGNTWSELHKSQFYLTDCTVDVDHCKVEVQPDTFDQYTAILAGMDKEYNLIDLLPDFNPVIIAKRPLIQLYVPGDSVISCFLGGTSWEQDATETTNEKTLRKTYKFGLCNILKEISVTGSGTPAATGLFVGRMAQGSTASEFTGEMYSDDSTYYIYISQGLTMEKDDDYWKLVGNVLVEYRRSSDDVALFRYTYSGDTDPFDTKTFTLSAVAGSGASGTLKCDMTSYNVYGRYLMDTATYGGVKASEIPTDDITDNSRHYHYATAYAQDVCYISYNFSDDATKYGLADNGKYFAPPDTGVKYYPIAQSAWRYASLWFAFAQFDWADENSARKRYLLRDAYTYSSCINALLRKIAPDVVHGDTEAYGQFLYAKYNPLNKRANARLLLTPKSNITNGEYQTPAQKAPVTFSGLMSVLANLYRAYWYVEDGKLKIESAEWFRRGGTYTDVQQVGIDLTAIYNKRNGKPYDYAQNSYTYDKQTMPARYEFAFMDDVTDTFAGSAIEVLSPYVEESKTEDITISNVTTDIDYMMLNPGAISEDGFAMLAAHPAEAITDYLDYPFTGYGIDVGGKGDYTVPYINIDPLTAGKTATLKVVASGGGEATISWFDSDGKKIKTTDVTFAADGTIAVDVTIPTNAAQMSFFALGLVQARVQALTVADMWQLPFTKIETDDNTYWAQNGELSLMYVQPWCWIYNMPASMLQINGKTTGAASVERLKQQTIKYPCGISPDLNKLVKTTIGEGEINKISLNLSTLNGSATLRHDTEL